MGRWAFNLILLLSLLFGACAGANGGQGKPSGDLRKLDPMLSEFLRTPDREGYAKSRQIFYLKGRVRVYITFDPGISSGEKEKIVKAFGIEVEKESENLVRGMVPDHELAPLAREPLVWSIRLPDRPKAL